MPGDLNPKREDLDAAVSLIRRYLPYSPEREFVLSHIQAIPDQNQAREMMLRAKLIEERVLRLTRDATLDPLSTTFGAASPRIEAPELSQQQTIRQRISRALRL